MPFELIRKFRGGLLGRVPDRRSVLFLASGRLIFSKDIRKIFKNSWGVKISVDRKKKILMLEKSEDQVVSFKLTREGKDKKIYGIYSRGLIKSESIKPGVYYARFNNDKVTFKYEIEKEVGKE